MINDYASLISSGMLIVCFVVCGFLDILHNPVIKMVLLIGLGFLIVNVIIVKSKDNSNNDEQKNLP